MKKKRWELFGDWQKIKEKIKKNVKKCLKKVLKINKGKNTKKNKDKSSGIHGKTWRDKAESKKTSKNSN